jgi:glycosyltransferase involved in cell wall biosynthesis
MIIIIYSETFKGVIDKRLGESEYSYYFVLKEYRPVLERLGIVVAIADPQNEVDAIYRNAAAYGESCIFLSFAPPHQTLIDLECPTIPIFAWEFDTLPTEIWNGDARNDWRTTFRKLKRAITHSEFTVKTVKAEMGQDFPIVSIPAPVWDRFDGLYRRIPPQPTCRGIDLNIVGTIIDTAAADFVPAARQLPEPAEFDKPTRLHLDGVIYCSIFNPRDGRKNWFEMLCAFCIALRDATDATLVFKLTHHDPTLAFEHMLEMIYRLSPFQCRVVIILGYLKDDDYETLVGATSIIVNASAGEGQCLPLMEFMSAGKPAIAPRNTALADYLSAANSFPVASSLEPWCWPHDPRQAFRTRRHRVDFGSLMQAYRDSYQMAKNDPQRYARMSASANRDLKAHCSQDLVEGRLRAFLDIAPMRCDDEAAATAA